MNNDKYLILFRRFAALPMKRNMQSRIKFLKTVFILFPYAYYYREQVIVCKTTHDHCEL